MLLLQLLLMRVALVSQGRPAPCQGHFQSHRAAYLSVLPGGSLPQKAGTSQEGVKWSEERGESFQVPSVDRWACCPATTTQSYVRNEPASLQPCPGDSGVTQTDCHLPGGCFVYASCVGFGRAPDWRLASARGDRGQVSRWPAAGRPASGECPCLAPVS